MNEVLLRFAPSVDRDQYNKANPPSTELDEYHVRAISSACALMTSFTHLEKGFARLIHAGLAFEKDSDWKYKTYRLGKNFSVAQQIDMVVDLTSRGCLALSQNSISQLPEVFSKDELPYFEACRLAMQYRNELAHTGIIIWVQKEGNVYYHFPMIGLDNPRSDDQRDIFIPVDISARSTVYEDGRPPSLSFSDWVFQLKNRVPIFFWGTHS